MKPRGSIGHRRPAHIGEVFGALTIISDTEYRPHTSPSRAGTSLAVVHCRCVCGNEREASVNDLRTGKVKTCGCKTGQRKGGRVTHGHCRGGKVTSLYAIWRGMIVRCSDPNHPSAERYYHRGIRVCSEWLLFKGFSEWAVSHGYRDGLSIERKKSDRSYEPDNCEWITKAENTRRANADRKAREDWMVREILRLTRRVDELERQLHQ